MRFVCSLPRIAALGAGVLSAAIVACGDSETTSPPPPASQTLVLTAAQVTALDSTGQVIVQANPTDGTLKSLVDSTLLVLTAGVEAKRLDVATNLTAAPLFFVGVHRAVVRPTGSFSTWNVVGFDDPSHLVSLLEVNGFAQTGGATPPSSVSGTIGDGSGIVNGLLLQVGSGGTVTKWSASAGSVSFSSSAPGAACPGFTATPKVTCAMETMRVRFTATASGGRNASMSTEVDVPAMRLTFTP